MPDSMIDSSFITQTLQKIVQINSVNPGLDPDGHGEEEAGRYIHRTLENLGIPVETDILAPGRVNVTARIKGTGGGKSLMLNAHTDTVGVAGMKEPCSGYFD